MCLLCNPGIEPPFRGGLAPPWELSLVQVLSSHGDHLLPRALLQPGAPAPGHRFSLSPPALPPWMPLSSAIWPCCYRRSYPVANYRPTCGGSTTSVLTVPTSSASTSPGMEVRDRREGGQAWGEGQGPRSKCPHPPAFLVPQLRYRPHARHQQAQRLRTNPMGAGIRYYLCWQGWQPWWAMPCSAASSPSNGQLLPGPRAPGPWV